MNTVAAPIPVDNDAIDRELNQLCEEEAKKAAELVCPYCGWPYMPHQGCFCFRIVDWDELS